MPLGRADSDMLLWHDGDSINVKFDRVSPSDAIISWNLPPIIHMYDGIVITLKTSRQQTTDYPLDGNRYSASPDISAPSDIIGSAKVVVAVYGDKITTSANITGLDPNEVYFASGHAVSNTLNYFSDGKYSYPQIQQTEQIPGNIPEAFNAPINPNVGQVYYDRTENKVLMWSGSTWIKTSDVAPITGHSYPSNPVQGDFFYNLGVHKLYVFDGSSWNQANTFSEGTPSYAKLGIGTDGSSDEYAAIQNNIKRMMGWPVVCTELSVEQFNIALDAGIAEFRRRADNAYTRAHIIYTLTQGQSKYYLNNPSDDTCRIVNITKLHRLSGIGLNTFGDSGVYSQTFLNQFYGTGVVDLSTIYALSDYAEQYQTIFAGDLGFTWNETTRELQLLRKMRVDEKIVIECSLERTEQDLLTDRYASSWIQDWATNECMTTLGLHIRSKYATLPGAGGGISLNGPELLAQANEGFDELKRQIYDLETGGGTEFGNYSFVIG